MTKIKNVFLFAAAMTFIGAFTACSSDDENIVENEELTLGDPVRAQFTISIPLSSNHADTRMSAATVQSAQNINEFRGINDIKIFPAAVMPGNFNASSILGKDISLTTLMVPSAQSVSNYIPNQGLLNGSNSVLYGDVQLQIGTRTFLFYGKAIGDAPNEDLTAKNADYFFKYGHLNTTGLDVASGGNTSGFTFSPKEITTATKSDEKRTAICTYLNSIANAKVAGEGGEVWASSENVGYKNLYNNFTGMKAGSSTNLQVAVRDLYFALKENPNPLPQAICTAIKNDTYVTINETDKTVTFKDNIAGYPDVSDNLPEGAAVLNHATGEFKYVENSDNYAGMNVTAITQYAYPASLYYWGKSGILTSEESQKSLFTAGKTWEQIANATNYKNGNAISSKTRSVVLTEPVNYAVGRLDISVVPQYGVAIYDKTGVDVVDLSKVKLTGILIGGQKNVDWQFEPKSGKEYTLYDNIQKSTTNTGGVALSTSTDNYINSTLVLETTGPVGDTADKVNVALEFINNDKDFVGKDGIVAKGTKFYLVGSLDVSTVSNDEKNKTGGKVFKQDYITKAQFTIRTLKTAENTIPDLRNPNVEIGLSVNLTWQDGITFSHTFN